MNSFAPKSIVVAGVRLTYLDVGPSPAPGKVPLLLLHGLLATAETFMELIGNLPQDRRIVALDILSAAPAGEVLDVRAEALARLVEGFAESIGLGSYVVVGHSHGGALALWLAALQDKRAQENRLQDKKLQEKGLQDKDEQRGRILALALLCPAHPFAGYRSHVVAFYLTRWGRFLALSIPLAPSWMILRAYNEAAGPGRPITMAHLRPYLRVLRSRRTLARVLDMLRTWEADMSDLRGAMLATPIAQPTLLIWGDQDTVVPLTSAAALEVCLPQSELVVLPGRGHLLAEEAPVDCGRLIREWLGRLESGRRLAHPAAAEDSLSG